ncbi:hypothetical protein L3X38_017521 [Prunus dulcis]|uniref:Reverse transcriptase domain-containing protein n=1 Tax=Prunus dulcis TaxID=3755 RepID=A0AAD4W7A0_PRUDU|nr:hypothetical protein L3X38_017521 [Prunus dulcis]
MKQVVTPASGFAKSIGSNRNEVGKRNSLAKDSKVWVFKKPLKDITNAKLGKSSTMGLKPGFGSKNILKARIGHNRSNLNVGVVGMQVRGSDVQDDVHGLFSFNVDDAFSSVDFRGANVVLHDPEPIDIGQMELNEGESHLVKSGVSNEDEHDSVGDAVGLVGHAVQKSVSLIWPLQDWNKQVFGCLFQKKRRILARLAEGHQNKLERLTNDAGEWISEKGGMKQIDIHYFPGLFSEPTLSDEYYLFPQYFPQLELSNCTWLNGEVSDVEIQSSLFAIGLFCQSLSPEHLNDTLITPVPKILVSRLCPIMTKIVGPTQVSFVLGRHRVDNIVIAQEMLHKFKIAKGKKGFIAWKIDLSKAYDRLS